MTTRLTLILVAVLISTPVVFGQGGLRAHLTPLAGCMGDRAETTQAEAPSVHTGADCVVIGSNLLRPYRDASSARAPFNRPSGLAAGGNVACVRTASGS